MKPTTKQKTKKMNKETVALELEGRKKRKEILIEAQDEESLEEIRDYLRRSQALEELTRIDQEIFKDDYQ